MAGKLMRTLHRLGERTPRETKNQKQQTKMKTLENKINKMGLAIKAMEDARYAADEASRNISRDTESFTIDGKTIEMLTNEARASIEHYLQANKEARLAEKAAIKEVAKVAKAFGFRLKKKPCWHEDVLRLAYRLKARYEDMLAVMHKLSQFDEYLERKSK